MPFACTVRNCVHVGPARPGTRTSTYQTTTDQNGIATAGDFLANQQTGAYPVTNVSG
jgi:hypothetical protein